MGADIPLGGDTVAMTPSPSHRLHDPGRVRLFGVRIGDVQWDRVGQHRAAMRPALGVGAGPQGIGELAAGFAGAWSRRVGAPLFCAFPRTRVTTRPRESFSEVGFRPMPRHPRSGSAAPVQEARTFWPGAAGCVEELVMREGFDAEWLRGDRRSALARRSCDGRRPAGGLHG